MEIYSVNEIAHLLGLNPETVRRWVRSGKLKAIRNSRKEGNWFTTLHIIQSPIFNNPKYNKRFWNIIRKEKEERSQGPYTTCFR